MKALKSYLDRLINQSLTEEQLERVDKEELIDHLQYLIEMEIDGQEEWWEDQIIKFVEEML